MIVNMRLLRSFHHKEARTLAANLPEVAPRRLLDQCLTCASRYCYCASLLAATTYPSQLLEISIQSQKRKPFVDEV
jgi:hypothetical protein